MAVEVTQDRLNHLENDTGLILEALHFYLPTHPELEPIVNKLTNGIFEMADHENDLIWTTCSNYYKKLEGKKRSKMMQIAIVFDPYVLEIQRKLRNIEQTIL